jgi:hypothetical protein
MTLSKKETVELGNRLRDCDQPVEEDLRLLGEVLLQYNDALAEAGARLRDELHLEPTTRLKTSGTITDKLRRQRHLKLGTIHDLAGARVVRAMTLDDQDELAGRIMAMWPGSKLIDRREKPSHGYRAVHVVPRVSGCHVEIQLRTLRQDTWAQLMEMFGDVWGRAVRYGGEPESPDSPAGGPDSTTRRDMVAVWKRMAEPIYAMDQAATALQRSALGSESPPPEELLAGYAELDAHLAEIRAAVLDRTSGLS